MPKIKTIIKKNNYLAKNEQCLPLLISAAIKKNKEFVYSHPEYNLKLSEFLHFKYYLYLYKKGLPLAYILKNKEFYGLNFFVNKNVLIPRPDTETLVDAVIEVINNEKILTNQTLLIDIGTGSGCIPISILKTVKKQIPTIVVDISNKALKVAQKNSQHYKTNIKFIKSDLLSPLLNQPKLFSQTKNLIITANLPYLTEKQYQTEPTIKHEPKQALVAAQQGLGLYKKLSKQIKQLIAKHNFSIYIFWEIDPSQNLKIKNTIKQNFPLTNIQIKKDLTQRDRIVYFQTNH